MSGISVRLTDEQTSAIGRREGDLLLDASAGSGKTSVLVERFARSVLEDGVPVGAILTITFTEKAAAELRERIRRRLHELGGHEAARATEGAYISTIHGFCARLLRTHALAAGLDPAFGVLEEHRCAHLAALAFERALEGLASRPQGIELIAAYGAPALQTAIVDSYSELRSRGELVPRLPPLIGPPRSFAVALDELRMAGRALATELGEIATPASRVSEALERLERCEGLLDADPWPAELDRLKLPGGNGAALATEACSGYTQALGRFRSACEHRRAVPVLALLDELLARFGEGYTSAKRAAGGVDFADLELLVRELLKQDLELCSRYRSRFCQVMVDEFQDTNHVQLELIEQLAAGNLFTVGDAQQSIYAFRHADVALFERLGRLRAERGERATLQTNFRSRPEIITAINRTFSTAMTDRFSPLIAGREDQPAADARVELIVVEKEADWGSDSDGLAAPWRLAEANALAGRVRELCAAGTHPREVVVLTRASTDLRAYERALEDVGVPTYVIGGRGYWAHPQVLDVVAYLRALANPLDETALFTVLLSPFAGVSVSALVLLAAAARGAHRDPWWLLRDPGPGAWMEELERDDRDRLEAFTAWFAVERAAAQRYPAARLIERAVRRTGYDLATLALPGGERRLANVRKLMRLATEHELDSGRDLAGFLDLLRRRATGREAGGRESEAPVESEALDAVRLMTIHRAKGLEFPVVCVADLGRVPYRPLELIRLGRDGRVGLRLAEPGTGRKEPALAYRALGDEQQQAESEEERRLFYVAVTRARERLLLSGAAKLGSWGATSGGPPMNWLGPAFVPDLGDALQSDRPTWVSAVMVSVVRARPRSQTMPARPPARSSAATPARPVSRQPPLPLVPPAGPPAPRLSYSALADYARCGYRFYVERVLGIPALESGRAASAAPPASAGGDDLDGAARGVLVHRLLERLDFRRPHVPGSDEVMGAAPVPMSVREAEEISRLIAGFAGSELCARLGRAREVRREGRFAFPLAGGVMLTGALDVLAREADGVMLIVDYKSDRLQGAAPATAFGGAYVTQRVMYGLAALRAGARAVEVAHVFLEQPQAPVLARIEAAQAPVLEAELDQLTEGVLCRRFEVMPEPHRRACAGCPAEGGLCSWPVQMTRRAAADRLF
ncbi:MAG: UvrD-helicase domain-containing protein [Solirubrobacteraceae bacterium]